MGRYKAAIAARRLDRLRLIAIGVLPIRIDYAAMFAAENEAMEDRIEQEILNRFGGYDTMVATFEAEIAGKVSMTVAEAITYLRSFGDE